MAKKIKIEDYMNNLKKKETNRKDILKLISLIMNGVLIIGVIVLAILYINSLSKYDSMLKTKNLRISALELRSSSYDTILNGQTAVYVINKLNFFDENVVFQLEGYGKYYYTYDCVQKITDGKEYSYWAYNIDAAKGNGLKKGGC